MEGDFDRIGSGKVALRNLDDGLLVEVADDGTPPPAEPGNSTRIGLTDGAEHPWRWFVPGNPNLSR